MGRPKDGLPNKRVKRVVRLKSTCFQGRSQTACGRLMCRRQWPEKSILAPSVQLLSSTIGYDSGLFDRVRVRLRTVHHGPTVGSFWLAWTNEHNRTTPGRDPADRFSNRFWLPGRAGFVYTTEWQEVEVTLPESDGEVGPDDREVWEGLLQDIRLGFSLDWGERGVSRSASEVVGWLEIDWIELTRRGRAVSRGISPAVGRVFPL